MEMYFKANSQIALLLAQYRVTKMCKTEYCRLIIKWGSQVIWCAAEVYETFRKSSPLMAGRGPSGYGEGRDHEGRTGQCLAFR